MADTLACEGGVEELALVEIRFGGPPNPTRRRVLPACAAFTLIELLTVIAIIGIIAAIVAPSLSHFRKGDAMLSSTRQMLDAVARGRQLAISEHTTVYMVFVPPNFWANNWLSGGDPTPFLSSLTPAERVAATNLLDKQLTGYTYISLRSVGDQPGQSTPRYLSQWQTLPDSSFIALWKFTMAPNQTNSITDPVTHQVFPVGAFSVTNDIPFPSEAAAYSANPPRVWLPYIAFNYLGQLTSGDGQPLRHDVYIPLAHGSVLFARNPATRALQFGPPSAEETPPTNSITSFNLVHIDWLTGRARLEQQQVQ